MDEDGDNNTKIKTVIIVVGLVLAIIVFYVTWTIISSGFFEDEENYIKFSLLDEGAGPGHVFSLEWEDEVYGFEGKEDWHSFNIDHDRSYSFVLHYKDLTKDMVYDLKATVSVTEERGLVLDITENAIGNYTIFTEFGEDKIDEMEIAFLDFGYEIDLIIQEYTDVV
jgi:hypothetical protein